MNELEALSLLTSIRHIGSIKVRLLINHFGSAVDAVNADASSLKDLPGFGSKFAMGWHEALDQTAWKENIRLAEMGGMAIIPYTSPDYPQRLLTIPDHPILLYVRGTLLKKDQRCIAVVGTRQCSIYGLEMAKKISQELAGAGFTVVSGLARGIDTSAHEGALLSGRTLAVIGSGLGNIYPRENISLGQRIAAQGSLMSEFPPMTPPDRQTFPQRNRIVSGMSMGTVLIEAPEKSGAMITMERAMAQGRPIFALPGRVDQSSFRGNHFLIKQQYATLIESGADVAAHFDSLLSSLPLVRPISEGPAVEEGEVELMRQLPQTEISIEEVAKLTGWPVAKVNVLLMSLVLKKYLKEYPGKIYRKL